MRESVNDNTMEDKKHSTNLLSNRPTVRNKYSHDPDAMEAPNLQGNIITNTTVIGSPFGNPRMSARISINRKSIKCDPTPGENIISVNIECNKINVPTFCNAVSKKNHLLNNDRLDTKEISTNNMTILDNTVEKDAVSTESTPDYKIIIVTGNGSFNEINETTYPSCTKK